MIPSYQTLSNASDMSRNRPRTIKRCIYFLSNWSDLIDARTSIFKVYLIRWNKSVCYKKNQTSRYITEVQIFFHIRNCLSFFMKQKNFFFHSSGNIQLPKHELKVISRGINIDSPYYLNIWMLSWYSLMTICFLWI